MTRRERNEYIQLAVQDKVCKDPAFDGARKKILIITIIPTVFLVIDRIIAIAQGVLQTGSVVQILWGPVLMAAMIACARNGETVATAVWLFLSAALSAASLFPPIIQYGIWALNLPLLAFYILYIIVFVIAGILLLTEPQISAYHRQYAEVRRRAKAEAANM